MGNVRQAAWLCLHAAGFIASTLCYPIGAKGALSCQCFQLCMLLSAAWTDLPGVEMQQGKEGFAGSKVLQIRGNHLEFVLNDGAGQWDTPDPYGGSQTKNYTIETAGQYRLEAGKVSQTE